jgi:hypothetical protein
MQKFSRCFYTYDIIILPPGAIVYVAGEFNRGLGGRDDMEGDGTRHQYVIMVSGFGSE